MALPNDMQRISNGLAKLEVSDPTYSQASVIPARSLIRRTIILPKVAADAAAATATTYQTSFTVRSRVAGRLLAAYVVPTAAVTADPTNNATVSFVSADGLGGAQVVAATLTTDVAGGSWVAGVTKTATLSATAANLRWAAGAVLSFAITKAGTGVVLPISQIILDIEEESADAYPVY